MNEKIWALFCVVALGCGPSASGDGDGDGQGGDGGAPTADGGDPGSTDYPDAAPAKPCDQIDFLFVVDDSGSMGEEQSNLAANFPAFIDVIDAHQTSAGESLDYRVAVTTTGRDLSYNMSIPGLGTIPMSESGDDGEFRQDCGMTRRWLERADTDVATTFACAAQVGTGGPSIEMPLLTTRLALEDRVADGTNAGFLREDALLAIVVLTDEDDCSRADDGFTISSDTCAIGSPDHIAVGDGIAFLDELKGDRKRWAAAVIAGPGPGSCSSEFGDAIEAQRLAKFVTDTGDNAVFSSICDGDLSGGLADALETFDEACEGFGGIE